MILGLGIDIVAVDRIANMLEKRGDRALKRLYTEIEREYCGKMPHPSLHFAARFAAKEAYVKALGTGFSAGIRWKDIGIVNDAKGKPEIFPEGTALEAMRNLGATSAFVSLSHDPTHAAAVVVLE
ncbi:MAG: holo-ACP synthase [Candidatus Sumerlaeia bacterium]